MMRAVVSGECTVGLLVHAIISATTRHLSSQNLRSSSLRRRPQHVVIALLVIRLVN